MKVFSKISLILGISVIIFLNGRSPVFASSEQAYQDYVYQYDKYRAAYNEFRVAKNEYDKFKTLTSQTTVLEKTKVMLTWRNNLLRAYLLFLDEKLNENPGLNDSNKSLYKTLIGNENSFLEKNTELIPSIGSINDAKTVSSKLESHYLILQTSIRQIILGLISGQLNFFYGRLDTSLTALMTVLNDSREFLPMSKQSIADRWVVSINSKKNLYEQKMDGIGSNIAVLKSGRIADLDQRMGEIQKDLGEAKTYLQDDISYMKELMEILRYKE